MLYLYYNHAVKFLLSQQPQQRKLLSSTQTTIRKEFEKNERVNAKNGTCSIFWLRMVSKAVCAICWTICLHTVLSATCLACNVICHCDRSATLAGPNRVRLSMGWQLTPALPLKRRQFQFYPPDSFLKIINDSLRLNLQHTEFSSWQLLPVLSRREACGCYDNIILLF